MSDIGGFEFSVSGLDDELRVKSFQGQEAMSELFCFELDLVSRSYDINFDDVIDQSATLKLIDKQGNVRVINGVIASFEQGNTGHHFTHYKAVLMPSVHRLRYRSDNRIFQGKSVVEIMESVLKEAGIMELDFVCKEPHSPREYCVQYRETDLEFIERLASEEGFHYSFEHNEGSHKLVFADTVLGNPTIDLGDIEYNPNPGGRIEESYFKTFIWRKSLRTEHFSQRDYTFKFPDNNLDAAKGGGAYKKYDYPGRYKDNDTGYKFAEYQLDAERRDHAIGEISSDVVQLDSGSYFDFKGHRNDAYNKRYLVTDIHHEGNQPQVMEEHSPDNEEAFYHNSFRVVEYGVNWRPHRSIRPRVDGPQIAKVVGPSGEEIYTDEFGRVKVQFPWDRYGKSDEHSSCWIRVSQNWAGGAWGHMAIPRIDQEVIVEFLEGDPDQPIITGRTYHSSNRPPYPLPQNKTRMTIKSKTHKGDGFNELRFEDEKGKEEIFVHGEKDQNIVIKNNRSKSIGVDQSEDVGQDKSISVGRDHTESIGQNQTLNVGQDQSVSIGQDHTETIGRDLKHFVGQNYETEVTKDFIHYVNNHRKTFTYGSHMDEIGVDHEVVVKGSYNYEVGSSIFGRTKEHTLTADQKFIIGGPGGTIILDSSGVTIKGSVINLLGPVNFGGGSPDQVSTISLSANDALPICEECAKKKDEGE